MDANLPDMLRSHGQHELAARVEAGTNERLTEILERMIAAPVGAVVSEDGIRIVEDEMDWTENWERWNRSGGEEVALVVPR